MTPRDQIVVSFLDVARAQPGAPAISLGAVTLTYGQAAAQVEACAEALATAVAPGQCVALSVRKSPQAIVLMLSCLLARVPYVPIDPGAPLPRRSQILADADPALLLVSAATAQNWPRERFSVADVLLASDAGPEMLRLTPHVAVARRPAASVNAGFTEHDLAYVLYTSGSTGAPKGVMISTGNAGYFVDWAARAFPVGPGDRVAQHAPLHFDLPVYDIFVALTRGAHLDLMDERTVLFPAAFHRFLHDRAVTAVYAVPSAVNAMVQRSAFRTEGLPALRRLLYAGEEYHVARLRDLVAGLPPDTEVCNLYGPVETNVVTWAAVDRAALAGTRIPVGRAVPGTEVRVLGDDGGARSRAAEGELVVAGPSVSPGYLNDPLRTARTRIELPVDGTTAVFYRTGDFARIDAGGVVHFQGRRDGMVKTRGFRVELGDVEAALSSHPEVAQAAVLAVESPGAGTVLAAHVAPAPGVRLTGAQLRAWVSERLPGYMVPADVVIHEQLPTTATGKVARLALRATVRSRRASAPGSSR